MTPCFADTFFFLALLNPDDTYHVKAVRANRMDRPVLTTEWVLLELADHLCDVRNRRLTAQVRAALAADPRVQIVRVDPATLDRAIKLYDDRPDKDWSLTDCTSFVVMNDRGVTDVWTADHHFEQAGFIAVLK